MFERYRKIIVIAIPMLLLIIVYYNVPRNLPGTGLPSATIPIISIAAGNANSMVITDDGRLLVLGTNESGGLVNGTTNPPTFVEIKRDVSAISTNIGEIMWSANGTHSMLLTSNGDLWVLGTDIREYVALARSAARRGWGRPSRQFSSLNTPTIIMRNVVMISAGGGHSVAITSDGTLWGWGVSYQGQLGASVQNRNGSPARIMDDVIYVSAGAGHTMIITSDNTLWAWGRNSSGQLGDGTKLERRGLPNQEPLKIMEDVISVSAGDSHTMAITSDGTLWGWGRNSSGQLGNGSQIEQLEPAKILYDVIYVSAGGDHTMAITSNGTLWGWGANWHGQLGDGTTENRQIPVRIMDDVVAVSAGGSHTLAVTSDGALWAWGNNNAGQLGDGTTTGHLRPIEVMSGVLLP